ncbi:MAG TPA: GLPGLI family protein [Flavobacteriaceae bacterium]|nr:GLPGLI family protein [Flavobacteriaceae bacterium]
MKTIYLNLIFLLLINLNIIGQTKYSTEYKIQYEVEYSMDSLNLESKGTAEMYLFAGNEFGVFINESRATAEEKMEKFRQRFGSSVQLELGVNNSNNPSDLNKAMFTNLETGEVKVLQHFGDKDYVYSESQPVVNWEMTDKTKESMGYQTQMAKTHFAGRSYEAWFTMEIPVPAGPYVFNGLPGLIVELYDTENHYHFMMQSIEKLEEPKVWELPKSKKLSKEKVVKLQKKIDDNALKSSDYGYMMSQTSGVMGSTTNADGKITMDIQDKSGQKISKEELKRMYRAQLESRNNPIELE